METLFEDPGDAERRRRAEAEARRSDEDLARVASTPEGFRVLARLLARWGAEGPAADGPGLTLRNEAEALLAQLARVHPQTCLRLVAELRGIPF